MRANRQTDTLVAILYTAILHGGKVTNKSNETRVVGLTIFPDGPGQVGRGLLKQRDDVFVERIHVLEQPLVTDVVDATGVVQHAEVGLLAEVRFLELGMPRVLRDQLLHQRFVGRLRKPTLLVDYCQQTDRLQEQHVQSFIGHTFIPSVHLPPSDVTRIFGTREGGEAMKCAPSPSRKSSKVVTWV